MEERGLIELRASDTRQTYTRLRPDESAETIAADLMARFVHREESEIARLRQVLDLVTLAGCQVNALVAYFGEKRDMPCGHCTFCLTGKQGVMPQAIEPTPIPDSVLQQVAPLQAAYPGRPRLGSAGGAVPLRPIIARPNKSKTVEACLVWRAGRPRVRRGAGSRGGIGGKHSTRR